MLTVVGLFYINVVCFVADVPDAFISYSMCVLLLPCLKHVTRKHQDITPSPQNSQPHQEIMNTYETFSLQ